MTTRIRPISLAAGMATVLIAGAAGAQAPCRGVYMLGESVPPHCRASPQPGIPSYRQWSDRGGSPAFGGGAGAPQAPLFDRRFQGGYGSAYGLGR